MYLNIGKESMTDADKKELLFILVESRLDEDIYESIYYRIMGQISFAKLCGIITESESKELEDRVDSARRGKESKS